MPMQPKVFELGQWTPDAPELAADGVVVARNCVPTRYGYGPLGEYAVETDDLDDRARGAILSRDDTDAVFMYAGDETKLYVESGRSLDRQVEGRRLHRGGLRQLGVPPLAQSGVRHQLHRQPAVHRRWAEPSLPT